MSKLSWRPRGRRREHYWLGVQFSGLERPGQFVGAVLTVLGVLLGAALVAVVAFG